MSQEKALKNLREMKKRKKEACFRCGGAQCTGLKNLFKNVVCDRTSSSGPASCLTLSRSKNRIVYQIGLKTVSQEKVLKNLREGILPPLWQCTVYKVQEIVLKGSV